MDAGFARSRRFPSALKEPPPPPLRGVSENSALNRGPGPSDNIETRKGSYSKGGELMCVPIGDVLGIMVTLIGTIVLLLVELINAHKK